LKALASLKLAVVVLLALATITAWGTIVEAKFDAAAAHRLVYHSVWMFAVMIVLAINLIAVMVDRWPWQSKHLSFLLAHVGIIVLMIGSAVTHFFGIDGSMTFGIGEKTRHVMVDATDFTVYTSMDGAKYAKLYDREVDFYSKSPKDNPILVQLPTGMVKVIDFLPYALREEKIIESEKLTDRPAIRFQLQNARVSLTEWLMQPSTGADAVKDLGPAQVVLTSRAYDNTSGRNTIVLRPKGDDGTLEYEIHTARDPKAIKRGQAAPGDTIETGWMGLVLRVLKFIPHGREEVKFVGVDKPTPLTTSAIKIDYNGSEHWMALNSLLKLFNDEAVFVVAYSNRRLDLGFDLKLKDFRIGRYQGTMRAATYESVVDVPERGETTISMNEPLKHAGFTFYQASFQEDEKGQPVASVLSVNRDPGRWIKYFGSFLVVLGTIQLFWFKRKKSKAKA
jgi:hypothetical protein